MRLVRGIIVGALVLASCLACSGGNSNTCISAQGGVTNCGSGSAVGGGRPSSQTFAAPSASQPAPSTSQSTVIVSPVKEPQYLSDMQNTDGNANFDPGDMVIDKEDYADSVGICSQVKIISASCNWTGNWWIEYNVPAGYSSFKATIGFSNQSPSDCAVKVQISGDGESLYSHEI